MKKTNIILNSARKTMNITVNGRMEKEDSKIFLDQYHSTTRSINASEFTLEVDCTSMQLLNKEMYDDLGHVMGLYKSTGFKNVEFQTKPTDTVLKMQLNRIARGAGLPNYTIVDAV